MLHLGEHGALGLGLDHADRLAVDEEQVVDPPVAFLEDELPTTTPRLALRLALSA
jgi:hypothetical protein